MYSLPGIVTSCGGAVYGFFRSRWTLVARHFGQQEVLSQFIIIINLAVAFDAPMHQNTTYCPFNKSTSSSFSKQ